MWQTIRRLFSKTLRLFWVFVKEVLSGIAEEALAQVKDMAIEIVYQLAKTDYSNDEKRTQAFNKIKAYAQEKGIEIRDSLVSLIIELAVQKLKKENQ